MAIVYDKKKSVFSIETQNTKYAFQCIGKLSDTALPWWVPKRNPSEANLRCQHITSNAIPGPTGLGRGGKR